MAKFKRVYPVEGPLHAHCFVDERTRKRLSKAAPYTLAYYTDSSDDNTFKGVNGTPSIMDIRNIGGPYPTFGEAYQVNPSVVEAVFPQSVFEKGSIPVRIVSWRIDDLEKDAQIALMEKLECKMDDVRSWSGEEKNTIRGIVGNNVAELQKYYSSGACGLVVRTIGEAHEVKGFDTLLATARKEEDLFQKTTERMQLLRTLGYGFSLQKVLKSEGRYETLGIPGIVPALWNM